jgi:hypothetical protein
MYGREVSCRRCGRREVLMVPLEAYSRFVGGRDAAQQFPELSADLISLLEHGQCRSECVRWR